MGKAVVEEDVRVWRAYGAQFNVFGSLANMRLKLAPRSGAKYREASCEKWRTGAVATVLSRGLQGIPRASTWAQLKRDPLDTQKI